VEEALVVPDQFGGLEVEEPKDKFGGVAIQEPPTDKFGGVSVESSFTQEQPPQSGLERAARDWQMGGLARAPQGKPPPGLSESALGISPDMVPSGANTRAPWLTIPLSVAGKTAAGVAGYATSPQGVGEMVGAVTPAAPVIFAKWAYDMVRGGYRSAKGIADELKMMALQAFNNGIINANQFGPVPEGTTTQDHIQSLAENAANAVLMTTLGAKTGLHAVGLAKGALEGGLKGPSVTPQATPEPLPGVEPTKVAETTVEAPEPKQAPPTAPTGEVPQQAPSEVAAKVGEDAPSPTEPAKSEVGTPLEPSQQVSVTPGDTEGVGPGMGGALAKGEIPETGAGGEKYGVAERVRAERAQAGQVEPVEPGKGTTPEATIEFGRDIIRRDPEAGQRIMAAFEADPKKAISTEGIAVTRAHGEVLAAGARRIEEEFGTESREYQQAKEFLSDWDKRTKKMQTEWHKQGQAQQGETDIDTGSYTGLERARKQATGQNIPEAQRPKAKKIAADNKNAQVAVERASERINKRIQTKTNPEQAKVWELAKKYLDENKGLYGFDDLRNKIATDMGITPSKVAGLLAEDSVTKKLADDLWNKQRNARRLKEQAKIWLRELDTPGYVRALSSIPRAMFSLSVFGHGFVALGTHAPIVAFQPRFWNAYVRNFGKMYKMVFKPAYYEMQMQDLVRRDNYEVARRSGLQNDPFKYEEFHTGEIKNLVKDWIGEKNMDRIDKLASAGNRGYGVLKLLRQDMFDQRYNKLPDSIRKQEGVTDGIADGINHATGVTKKQAPKGSNLLLFAPRLAGSRVMWLGGDPIRAARAIANWKNATTAEKDFAVNQMKEKGWVIGTFASLLAANQGFLSATGSKQKINGIPEALGGAGFDPLASDFMKFKAAGSDIAYGGALLTMAKLPARVATAILYEGKGSKYVLEDERVDKVIGAYIRSQASPFAGTVADLALGRDYEERPLPAKMFGLAEQTGKVPKRLQEQGVDEPYNWYEFAGTKLPIPIAEGLKEGLRGAGMSDNQADHWLRAAAVHSLLQTMTGTRITQDTREE
jgi:hypothetical protein